MKRFLILGSTLAFAACTPTSTNSDLGGDGSVASGDMAGMSNADLSVNQIVSLPMPVHGFQLATDVVDIASGEEWQACYFYKVPDINKDGKPFYVNKIEMAQDIGSHHMNVFRQNTVVAPDPTNPDVGLKGPNPDGTGVVVSKNGTGACFKSSNWADWPLVVNSQIPSVSTDGTTQPYVLDLSMNAKKDNVAYKFTPGEILMLQSHFVNATTQKTPYKAYAVANFNQDMNVTNIQEVGTLFATKQSIAICKNNPDVSFSGFCQVPGTTPITIIAANGHFHSRGKEFTISSWDGKSIDPTAGTQFYDSKTWAEPPMATGLNIAAPAGAGIAYTCSYEWAPSPACLPDGCSCIKEPAGKTAADCCYGFGGVVEISEHCNAFVYYYPALPNFNNKNCM